MAFNGTDDRMKSAAKVSLLAWKIVSCQLNDSSFGGKISTFTRHGSVGR